MKFYKDSVPYVSVIDHEAGFVMDIKSVQEVDEYEDTVRIKCGEFVEPFKKGYVCNLVFHYEVEEVNGDEIEKKSDVVKDLVLVYINKRWDINGYPQIEYIFYK